MNSEGKRLVSFEVSVGDVCTIVSGNCSTNAIEL